MATLCDGETTETRQDEEDLVRRHLALVGYAVNDFARRLPRHVCRADLESAGMEGLAQAARSYDVARGVAFDRYAAYRIRGALLDELRRLDWVGRTARGTARNVESAHDELTSRLGRTPTTDEVAKEAGVDVRVVRSVGTGAHRANILHGDGIIAAAERAIGGADARTPEVELLDRERRAYLLDAVTALPERLRRVVVAYFFEERQMKELAGELGVSEGRVSQMRAEALLLLRDGLNCHLDPDLVPEPRPGRRSRNAERRAAYYAAIAAGSDYNTRLTSRPMAATG
jgi:RNA polymerase sigma factor for flagellar operon FliA